MTGGATMSPRRINEVAVIAGTPVLTIRLSHASACRCAEFELRTGVKIEAAILSFLEDELFNIAPAANSPPSHGGENGKASQQESRRAEDRT